MTPAPSQSFLTDILPQLQPCKHLQLVGGDVVIHAPGFEDRTMTIAENVESSTKTNAILLDYIPFNEDNRLLDVREALLNCGIATTEEDILAYNRFNPGDFESRLATRLKALKTDKVIIDISTMSKLAIILTLNVCNSLKLHVQILYSEAKKYGPSEDDFLLAQEKHEVHRPSLQVFTGVHGVIRVESLASVGMQGQPTAAIVFMSFNNALTQVLLNTIYPARLFLINSRPPVHSWREKATAWIHDQVRREWEEDNPVIPGAAGGAPLPERAGSTLDYRETVSLLLQLYWDLSATHRVLLAPSGSKMQAVGCYLVKALHRDIHIEYPSPEGFFRRYSTGVGPQWLLDLDDFTALLLKISNLEQREYLEIPI